jgi:hypothetical protein
MSTPPCGQLPHGRHAREMQRVSARSADPGMKRQTSTKLDACRLRRLFLRRRPEIGAAIGRIALSGRKLEAEWPDILEWMSGDLATEEARPVRDAPVHRRRKEGETI